MSKCNWKFAMRCRDYLGNTGDCRFDTTECEHHVTIPDAPPKSPLCPKCGSVIGQNQMNDGHWHCRNLSCDWTQPDPAQRPKIPDAREGLKWTEFREYRKGDYAWWYPSSDHPVQFESNYPESFNGFDKSIQGGKRWIAVKDKPAKSKPRN